MRTPALVSLLASALVAGCTVGPDYAPPRDALPPAFARAPAAMQSATPPDAPDLGAWWRGFHDPVLDGLVAAALVDSPDVRTAQARLRQARQGVIAARSQFLPQVNASAGPSYLKFSKNAGFASLANLFGGSDGGGGDFGGITLPGSSISTYAVGFDASWELDLFGGTRREVEAARARVEGAEWQLRDAQVSLAAEVANSYLQFRTLQQREAIARQEAARQRRDVSLRTHTAAAGLAPAGDAIRQTASLASAEAQVEPLVAEQAIQVHALGVLVGKPPETLIAQLSPAAATPASGTPAATSAAMAVAPALTTSLPPPIPPGLPADLLRRRPDVRAAERQLAAATADVGIAVADLYPKLSLTGAAQLISTGLASLFEKDSLQLRGGASAMFPVLDFGRRRATVGQRREDAEIAYQDYQKTVLGALKDVEDALVRIDTEQRRNRQLRLSVANGTRALATVEARYASGLVDLSAVLQDQQQVLAARDALSQSDGALRQDMASLYKALGGGWQEDAPATPPPAP